jgi:predicted  nucleic acid-binding Zn-ribbon protein
MVVPVQLFRLEQLDTDLEQRRAALAEVRRRLQRDPEGAEAEARLERAQQEERESIMQQRRLEGDLAEVEARLKRDHGRLYSGSVIDPRELASLEKEMQGYRERRDETETALLDAMERAERLESELAALSREVNQRRERRETDRPALERQAEELAGTLARLQGERDALAAGLDKPSLDLYTRLRHRAGHAISHVSDGVCQWCRVAIPPKDVQHARAGTLVSCSNCGRILFVG